MAIQGSGQITINDIITEFGGTSPHSLSEYYRGGSLVPDASSNSSVPTSGQIELSDFYGTQDLHADAIAYQSYVQGQSGTIRDIGMVSDTYNAMDTVGINNTNTLFAYDFTGGGYKSGTNSRITDIYDLSPSNFHISNSDGSDRPVLQTGGFEFIHTEGDRFYSGLSSSYSEWTILVWLNLSGYPTENWGGLNGFSTAKNYFFTRNGSGDILYYRDNSLNYHTLGMTGYWDDWVLIVARSNTTNIKVYINGYSTNKTWDTGADGILRLDYICGGRGGSINGIIGKYIVTTDTIDAVDSVDFYNATKHHYGL